MLPRTFAVAAAMLLAADDFVDPRQHDRAVFASRLIVGGVNNYVDDYRPLHQNVRFVHVANSVYWSRFQADYKHSEVRPEPGQPPLQLCSCDPPVYYPTPPRANETPAPPSPEGRDTLQFGWYAGNTTKRRYRLTASNQSINAIARYPNSDTVAKRFKGHERAYAFEGDTPRIPILGFGTVSFARTVRSRTPDNRNQSELTYTNRFPGFAY